MRVRRRASIFLSHKYGWKSQANRQKVEIEFEFDKRFTVNFKCIILIRPKYKQTAGWQKMRIFDWCKILKRWYYAISIELRRRERERACQKSGTIHHTKVKQYSVQTQTCTILTFQWWIATNAHSSSLSERAEIGAPLHAMRYVYSVSICVCVQCAFFLLIYI